MKCEQFERRLNQAFDQRAALDKQLDLLQHADHCEACQSMLAAAMIVEDACSVDHDHLAEQVLPNDFSSRVVAQYMSAPVELAHRAQVKPLVPPVLLASLAGMILLALLPLVAWLAQPSTSNDPARVAQVDQPAADASNQSVGAFKSDGQQGFLGPHPFGTGGNLALALTIMPFHEQMNLGPLEGRSIPGVEKITDSIQRVVRIFRWSFPPFPFHPM